MYREDASFGEQLRRLREAAGLTQEELAARANLTANAISALERGERRQPYPHTVRALADALELPEDERATLIQAVPRRGRGDAANGPTPVSGSAATEIPSPSEKLRVLIADDHPLFRDGMRGLLSTQPDMVVVGEATTGEEAMALTAELAPDVVLMDISMPGLGGIEATRRIMAADPRVRILVVTMFEDDATVFTAMRAGARGYVLKDDDKDDVLGAIRAVGRGGAVFGPGVAARLADFLTTSRSAVPREAFPALTDREREMLHLMAKDASNTEIAHLLSLSPKTVANYVSSILHKLQVADRKQAALRAREAGLGRDTP